MKKKKKNTKKRNKQRVYKRDSSKLSVDEI